MCSLTFGNEAGGDGPLMNTLETHMPPSLPSFRQQVKLFYSPGILTGFMDRTQKYVYELILFPDFKLLGLFFLKKIADFLVFSYLLEVFFVFVFSNPSTFTCFGIGLQIEKNIKIS